MDFDLITNMKYYTKVKDDEALFDRFALDTKKKIQYPYVIIVLELNNRLLDGRLPGLVTFNWIDKGILQIDCQFCGEIFFH